MMEKKHFAEGLPALYQLSTKSPEHIGRSIKRYWGLTPTEWVNSFRLQYAAHLLYTTDTEILDIAMESGFDNLSHFYHLFKRKYTLTPAQYRKTVQRTVIPGNNSR